MTATVARATEIRLRSIRSHEGSQARAWEELAYQLRPPVDEGHVETRKTRAPDAGVEWYEVYADGHQEGFQAKFHATLSDALSGMRESVEAVCTKRPKLTKLTFVVPYDFTDSGTASTKTDQDRWDEAVARWRTDFPLASQIEFATVRAGDIITKLTLKEHAGRREYWFGGLEITDEWLMHRFAESTRVAGARYTPEADSPTSINDVIDGVTCGPTFIAELRVLTKNAIAAARQDVGIWGASAALATTLINELDEVYRATHGATDSGDNVLPGIAPDLAGTAALTSKILDLAYLHWESLPSYGRRNLDITISALQALRTLTTGSAAKALASRAFALVGPAGQGKTHALMRAVDGCLERGVPAIAILGQRLSDKNWWPAAAETLGGVAVGSDEFFQALDSLAEARQCRALVVIDAINESQSPKRWRDELPAMLAHFEKYPHLALIVSFRTDYRDVVGAPASLLKVRHPGLAGMESEALAAYCKLFGIPVPSKGLYEPALSSPLFLRMYCEVIAAEPHGSAAAPSRSDLFERYAKVIGKRVASRLDLSPASTAVSTALTYVVDRILANGGSPVPRDLIEEEVDAFFPGQTWPNTLFQQMASEGLIEIQPTYDGTESVTLSFQAYSEHLLANRLLASVDAEVRSWFRRLLPLPRKAKRRRALAKRIADAPWSWRSLAVTLPEREGRELIDLLPLEMDDFRLQEAVRESLTDRAASAFGLRALELLHQRLTADSDGNGSGVETVLALAPRDGHPGNADWLHAQLVGVSMADRDASWSIATFRVDQHSDAFRRLTRWVECFAGAAIEEEVRLAAITLMWLLASPNRFLRDGASKTLVTLMSHRLKIAASLIATAQQVDDLYVQERTLTCSYGAVLVAGDADLEGVRSVLEAVTSWARSGLPVDVLARDSARGIAAWCSDRNLLHADSMSDFAPPYGAPPPEEPPTREDLKEACGPIKDAEGNYTAWRASSILHSCLDWYGDFNKYVVKGDVEFFSWYPLSGPAPSKKDHKDPTDEVDVNWAGRWIANRAISLGWTAERFEAFERNHDLRRGREGHKAERFGKKYQWIAHRELLARLADNFHPAYERWHNGQNTYQGPWVWYGRDFDPTLPPSFVMGESQVCRIARDATADWATLRTPEMDINATPDEWVAKTDDLPTAASMFSCADLSGRKWVAIQRYSTWDRDNAQRTGMSRRERDLFFLQFSWLVPRGGGVQVYEFIKRAGLSGRRMPEARRTHHQYLGEGAFAPIVSTAEVELDDYDTPSKLRNVGLRPRPAAEQYLWEGNTLDCSIDESVDFYAPTPELLGRARWVGHQAAWSVDGQVVARSIEFPDGEKAQGALLVDEEWLKTRLRDLDADMVIGTLSERHALPMDDDDYRRMASSDVWYVALVTSDSDSREVGPLLKVRRQVRDSVGSAQAEQIPPEEPFDLAST
ncbi:hypothetical protein [Micromonospora sp. NBC_01796]|uniref:hypothetical protein n=1 Tax=Micromonospora sp. NBC_01796 TaxID=2975987 RepID=UPI002DD7AADC|nr:hypothetical protein [Micromonospora sp. NBC_01796]WSA83892.1 hypothetical protein OIE47_26455 [Micromonospora sp. NBC_01796]